MMKYPICFPSSSSAFKGRRAASLEERVTRDLVITGRNCSGLARRLELQRLVQAERGTPVKHPLGKPQGDGGTSSEPRRHFHSAVEHNLRGAQLGHQAPTLSFLSRQPLL